MTHVKGEALAVADAMENARQFVLRCKDRVIVVDHKHLKVFGDRSLKKIPNARLRNLKEKKLRYKFKMLYVPGAKHIGPYRITQLVMLKLPWLLMILHQFPGISQNKTVYTYPQSLPSWH